jgi:RHS repeat-associated protein
VASGTNTVAYSYLADSPLVGEIWFTNGSTLRMTTSKSYDFLNRLTHIVSEPIGSSAIAYRHAYNAANQRTSITNLDKARWVYQYDSLGQVVSGKKYWSDGTPVAGQHFEYTFDDVGNRQSTKAGGDNSGANLRLASYLNNALSQILSREVPSYVNVLGTASNNATVTLWGDNGSYSPTSRKGEYFRGELYANNSTGAVWLTITNVAVLNNGANPDIVTNVTGKVALSKTPEVFTYDLDGNLTRDGLWTNTWNAENRRTVIESGTGVPPAARRREQWTHLPDGRWIQRIVSTNNGAAYYPAYTNRYVWDGQVLLAILDHTNGLVMSFLRGLDLSGAQAGPATVQGAGGVGGVLAVTFKTNGTHFFCYDGNGNVVALVNSTNGSESARYEYGPSGEPLRMTGPLAKLNPIRFSTQYADDVTGDVKYLFRDYDSDSGRWPNRDPIGERGGKNLFAFVGNDSVNKSDFLGWAPSNPKPKPPLGRSRDSKPCCDRPCDKEGARDVTGFGVVLLPGNMEIGDRDIVKEMKESIDKLLLVCLLDPAEWPTAPSMHYAVDRAAEVAGKVQEQRFGVKLYTKLGYRECLKGRCKIFGKCSPLHWKPAVTDPRLCKPNSSEAHTEDGNAFVYYEAAAKAKSRCEEEHRKEFEQEHANVP